MTMIIHYLPNFRCLITYCDPGVLQHLATMCNESYTKHISRAYSSKGVIVAHIHISSCFQGVIINNFRGILLLKNWWYMYMLYVLVIGFG